MKDIAAFYRASYQTYDLVREFIYHFPAMVEVADAAREFVKGDTSSFRLKKALNELESL